MPHVNHLKDFDAKDLADILSWAQTIKANPNDFRTALSHQSMAMLFQKTSTRTRVSFEVAMTELGGHALFLDWQSSNFILTDLAYEIEYLSRNVQVIMARLLHNSDFLTMAGASQVPMINGCCERYHPCQALTDVLTMTEHSDKPLEALHLLYTGVQNNVSNSLVLMADRLGFSLTLATPEPAETQESFDADLQAMITHNPRITRVADPRDAIAAADFLYTDTWIDMQYFNNPNHKVENEAKLKKMMPYQLNDTLLAGVNCKVMHDMPIHDGFEISAELTKDPRAIMYEQAENRLHAQKGLLYWLYNN